VADTDVSSHSPGGLAAVTLGSPYRCATSVTIVSWPNRPYNESAAALSEKMSIDSINAPSCADS